MVWPGVTFGALLANVTIPVTELYVPTPKMTLVTVTLPTGSPGLNFSVSVTLVAVALGAVLMFVKLTVPVTVEPATAFTGKPAKLTLISAELSVTLKLAVLFAGLASLNALVVPVPATPVVVCKKLIEALTVALGLTLTSLGANVTTPVAGM